MTRILRVDASARAGRSLSRKLGDRFIDEWTAREPDVEVMMRDVGMMPPPIISEAWIAAVFSAEMTAEQRDLTKISDELIAEVAAADLIVITTPMYNYGMPAALKALFDQVVRLNKTFTFDLARGDRPLEPVFSDKTVVALTSWGEFGFGPGEVNEGATCWSRICASRHGTSGCRSSTMSESSTRSSATTGTKRRRRLLQWRSETWWPGSHAGPPAMQREGGRIFDTVLIQVGLRLRRLRPKPGEGVRLSVAAGALLILPRETFLVQVYAHGLRQQDR